MWSKAINFLVMTVGFTMVSTPASAHHGVTNYDMKKTIVLTGTITAFDWSNPHCLAYLDVTEGMGKGDSKTRRPGHHRNPPCQEWRSDRHNLRPRIRFEGRDQRQRNLFPMKIRGRKFGNILE
jgi:hypothetical protein